MPSNLSADPRVKIVDIKGAGRFKIRELTIGEYDELEKKATSMRPNPVNPDAPEIEVTDRQQLLKLMVLKCVVEPRLRAADLADLPMHVAMALNNTVNKMHFPDEKDALADIVEIDADEEEEAEEATKGEG